MTTCPSTATESMVRGVLPQASCSADPWNARCQANTGRERCGGIVRGTRGGRMVTNGVVTKGHLGHFSCCEGGGPLRTRRAFQALRIFF